MYLPSANFCVVRSHHNHVTLSTWRSQYQHQQWTRRIRYFYKASQSDGLPLICRPIIPLQATPNSTVNNVMQPTSWRTGSANKASYILYKRTNIPYNALYLSAPGRPPGSSEIPRLRVCTATRPAGMQRKIHNIADIRHQPIRPYSGAIQHTRRSRQLKDHLIIVAHAC